MRKELVPEMLKNLHILMWMSAGENVIIPSNLPQYNHIQIISINSTVLLTKLFM